jgi:hypothetical protein
VVTRARLARLLLIATPFVLLAVGTWALTASPWPAIWGLTLKGRHVFVPYNWSSVGLGAIALGCYLAALVISFNIKRERP